jgi:HEAT repeat protein
VPFEQALIDLNNPDAGVRRRTVEMLKEAAYPEAALPLAPLVLDSQDDVQLAAIAAELNIFLADKIIPRRRVGFIVEVRKAVAADAVFDTGPLAIGPRTVPIEVLDALRAAARDDNPRVRLEAVYAFGVLAVEPGGARRRELLYNSARDLAAMIGAVDPYHRYAALRVLGRILDRRQHDAPVEQYVGDTVVAALNERERSMQSAAMQALGAMRYPRAVQALVDLFEYYEKGDMAEEALQALARTGHPSAIPVLAQQLGSRNATFRGIAIEGLARAGDRARLADVERALSSETGDSLQLAGRFAAVMLGDAGLDPLVDALASSRLRDQALWYLIDAAPGRTKSFARYLQDPDPAIRADLVNALALSDDSAALELLQPMSADADVQVAKAVERAIARLRQQ